MSDKLIDVGSLAEQTGLPMRWLVREADAGRLPCLRVGRRRMFSLEAVRSALAERMARRAGLTREEFIDGCAELALEAEKRNRQDAQPSGAPACPPPAPTP